MLSIGLFATPDQLLRAHRLLVTAHCGCGVTQDPKGVWRAQWVLRPDQPGLTALLRQDQVMCADRPLSLVAVGDPAQAPVWLVMPGGSVPEHMPEHCHVICEGRGDCPEGDERALIRALLKQLDRVAGCEVQNGTV